MLSTAHADRASGDELGPHILLPCIDPADAEAVAQRLGPARSRLRIFVDEERIGPDRAYMRLWKAHAGDVILWHADMFPVEPERWFDQLLGFVERYPQAGIFGGKLLYPVEREGRPLIQSAGGYIDGKRGLPHHFGGGVDLFADGGYEIHECAEVDRGQYEQPRRVQWVTFGGCYIRRCVLDAVGDMDPNYRFSYYSDVDYCLTASSLGFEVYYLPIPILHYEGKDNKQRSDLQQITRRNRAYFRRKWGRSRLEIFRRTLRHWLGRPGPDAVWR